MVWTNRITFFLLAGLSANVAAQTQSPVTPAPVVPPPASTKPAPLSGMNLGEFDTGKPGQLKWENNPFVQTLESVGVQDMRLTAIVYRPGNAAALINGRIMKEGDRIGSSQVVHIEAKRVVMRNEDGIYSLSMTGSSK